VGTILQKHIESRQESHLKEDPIEYPVSIILPLLSNE